MPITHEQMSKPLVALFFVILAIPVMAYNNTAWCAARGMSPDGLISCKANVATEGGE